MCGLVAVINKMSYGFTKEQCAIFDTLLFIDQLRGMHSTGSFLVDNTNQMQWIKEASNATDFRQTKVYHDHLNAAFKSGSALVGHNRHATKGEISDVNAHPFTVDDRITLIHNGTLYGDHKKLADTEVDSHAIAHVIHNNGDDVEKALRELTGAYALIWHDYKNQTLNFVRNSQRPLFWIETPTTWIWSSEPSMLNFVIERFSLKPVAPPQSLEAGNLCTFTLAKGKWEITNKSLVLTAPAVETYSKWTGGAWYDSKAYQPVTQERGNSAYLLDGADDIMETSPFVLDREEDSILTPLPPPRRSATSSTTIRLEDIEEELALRYNGETTWAVYKNISNSFQITGHYAVRFKEVTEVAPGNPGLGNFVYASLEEDPSYLVKIHMAPMTTEAMLLDLVVNERRGLVQLTTKEWRLFSKRSGAAVGLGYAVLSCRFVKELDEKEVDLPLTTTN